MADEQFLPTGYDVNLTYSIHVLKSFLDFGERNMENEIELIKKTYNVNKDITLGANITDEMKDIGMNKLMDWYEELWGLTNDELRSKLRQSVLIQLYSFMESFLFKQCDSHKVANNKEYSAKELRGNTDLEKVTMYYKRSAGVNMKQKKEYQFIDNFRRLRNSIVHKEGRLGSDDLKVMQSFSKGNFEINAKGDENYIILSNRIFIDICIDTVKSFLSQLILT